MAGEEASEAGEAGAPGGLPSKDVERALVSKMAQTATVERLISRGIHAAQFSDPSCKGVFEFCADHTRKYRTPPSYKRVREANPGFGFEVVQDALDYWIDSFVSDVMRRTVLEGLYDIAKKAGRGTRDECITLDQDLIELTRNVVRAVPSQATSKFSDMMKRKTEYEHTKREGVLPGVAMGIKEFDDLTLGIQPHEYVSIVGWQGTGKSTLAGVIAMHAYAQGKTPMIVSLEMDAPALWRKFDVMMLNLHAQADEIIRYHDLKALTLSDTELKRWEMIAAGVEQAENDIIVVDDVGRPTVDVIDAEIKRRGPDLVVIDYVSLMEAPQRKDAGHWEGVTFLTRNLKRIARSEKCPIIGLAQTNASDGGEGATLNNIAYSRSIGQDSDLVFGLHQSPEMKDNAQMQIRMLKNRDGPITATFMHWDMPTMKFLPWKDGMQYKPKSTDLGLPGPRDASG